MFDSPYQDSHLDGWEFLKKNYECIINIQTVQSHRISPAQGRFLVSPSSRRSNSSCEIRENRSLYVNYAPIEKNTENIRSVIVDELVVVSSTSVMIKLAHFLP